MHAFIDCSGLTSVTIGNSMTKLVDTAYYTSRHILQYQPTFNIVRYIPLQHAKQRGILNFTDKTPHEVCVFEITRMKCLKYVNFEEFSYLSEYQQVTHLAFLWFKKWAPKPQLLGVESLGLMR